MKKSVLKFSNRNDDESVLVYALSTAETDLRLCMLLNKGLDIQLSLASDFEIVRRKELLSFRQYHYELDPELEKVSIIKNRSETAYFIPELKMIDYILVIRTEGIVQNIENKIENLKSVPELTVISKVDHTKLTTLKKLF